MSVADAVAGSEPASTSSAQAEQLRQLGEVRRREAGLVPGEQLGRRASTGLVLKIEITERLPVRVADDETLRVLVDHQGGGKRRAEGIEPTLR